MVNEVLRELLGGYCVKDDDVGVWLAGGRGSVGVGAFPNFLFQYTTHDLSETNGSDQSALTTPLS